MKVIGLLSWFEEPLENLIVCIKSLNRAGVDHLVAVDGRYALYAAENAVSSANEHAMIVLACRELGMNVTLHVPSGPWAGNEVEKRTYLFGLGWAVAQPGDWFFVMDGDQEVTSVPSDFKARLEASDRDVAEVNFYDTVAARANQENWPPYFTVRCLFRAQPIHLEVNHITHVTDDGRYLWGGPDTYSAGGRMALEPALDMTSVLVTHRPDARPHDRLMAKMQYYARRDEERVERGACQSCGKPAARLVPLGWRITELGPVADWVEACESCARRHEVRSRYQLRKLGIDPNRVTIENRNGVPPADPAGDAADTKTSAVR